MIIYLLRVTKFAVREVSLLLEVVIKLLKNRVRKNRLVRAIKLYIRNHL